MSDIFKKSVNFGNLLNDIKSEVSKLKDVSEEAGKNASDLLGKAKDAVVRSADQNDDGKFNKEDVSAIAESVSQTVKSSVKSLKESTEEKSRQLEMKRLKPIFAETIDADDFVLPKFIRVTERDKKYINSEVCQGSIGYFSEYKDLKIVNIFRDSLAKFRLSFYPDSECEFYYIDPSDRDRYISLDDYFSYLKVERINELQMLAKSLGAKHFKVTYIEEQTSVSEKKAKGSGKVTGVGNADLEHKYSEQKYSSVEIAAELDFPGHDPIMPQLKYMLRDPSIKTLISMRMDTASPLSHQKFMLKMSNSSGIKESDALKIDAVIKGMKVGANTNIANEAKNESNRYLEYEIDF